MASALPPRQQLQEVVDHLHHVHEYHDLDDDLDELDAEAQQPAASPSGLAEGEYDY